MDTNVVNNTIYEKIVNKGSLDAQVIANAGKEAAEKIETEILSEAKAEAEKILNSSKIANNNLVESKRTELERLEKQQTLFKKKELIAQVFIDAKAQLTKIADDKLFGLICNYIKNENIAGDEYIQVSKEDYSKYLALLSTAKPAEEVLADKLNNALGDKYQLKLSNKPANIDSGFVIVGKNFDIDFSFNSILNIVKEKEETKIASILFEEVK